MKVGRKIIHGDALRTSKHSYLYRTWSAVKERCYKENTEKYKWWGGRGIIMYEEWRNNYPLFKEYILINLGERPKGYSLDRKDNDGNYEPGNIRWADIKTQADNQRKGNQYKKSN